MPSVRRTASANSAETTQARRRGITAALDEDDQLDPRAQRVAGVLAVPVGEPGRERRELVRLHDLDRRRDVDHLAVEAGRLSSRRYHGSGQ